MYRIVAYDSPTDAVGHVVFDPRINRYISDGKLDLKESEIDNLTLTVNQKNYLFGTVRPMQTHAEVYQDNSLLFRGRALDVTRQMKDNGQFLQTFTFESIQNYLQDTSQRWAKVQNTTPKQFFQRLIDTHNSQVPDYKKFTVRNVDVTNSTDNVYRYIEDGATTWDTIKDKLVSRLGGFVRVEYVDGVNYIDYLQNPGKDHSNDTPIQIAKNLQSASVQIDPTEVITQLVPLGATIEQNEENSNPDTQVSQPRIDIKSVNDGKDYIDITDLKEEFGIIRKSVQWDDVHEPAILLSKAKQWIAAQGSAKESWTVNALELPQFSTFQVSDRYSFVQPNITTPKMLRVTGKTIDFANPNKSTLTIGDRQDSLTAYQLENQKQAEQSKKFVAELSSIKSKQEKIVSENNSILKEIEKQNKFIYPWYGATFTALGDSITQGYTVTGPDSPWTLQIKPDCKFGIVTNEGVGGSRIALHDDEKIESFVSRVGKIKNQDFITVLGGINDFHGAVELGSLLSGDTYTFCGALNYVAETLTQNNPDAHILWMTPLVNTGGYPNTYDENGQLNANSNGYTQNDYVQAIIQTAQHYSLSVLDLFNKSVIDPITKPEMFADGVHPTADGYILLGQQIADTINKIKRG